MRSPVPLSPVPVIILLLLVAPPTARAQRIAEGYHFDPPNEDRIDEVGADAKLVAWITNVPNTRESRLYFRNTSDRPMDVISYEIYDCINISGVECGVEQKGPRIEPGETVVVETARHRNMEQRSSYMYKFQVRFAGPPPRARTPSPGSEASDGEDASPEPLLTGWVPARFEYVDRVMPILMRQHSVPGVAIVLMDDARVQWSAGYGATEPDGPAITPSSVFAVGRLGRPVIAFTLQRLGAARNWTLPDPVSRWAHAQSIPSGFEDTSAEELLSGSDPGYELLQELVELAEGHDLEVLARALVLEPHHLPGMSFVPPVSGTPARGHDHDGAVLANAGRGAKHAAASLFASATDYARFLVEVSPLSRRDVPTWRRMTAPRGELSPEFGVRSGLGWSVAQTAAGSPIAFVADSQPGFGSFALVDEVYSRCVVILTNGGDGLALAADILGFLDAREHDFLDIDLLKRLAR